jgi:hypothetical protein
LLVVALAAAGVAFAATAAEAMQTRTAGDALDPRALVLRRADLPAGFHPSRRNTGPVSAEQAAQGGPADAVAKLESFGRIAGYQADFARKPTIANLKLGPVDVLSQATVYRDDVGGADAFAYGTQFLVPRGFVRIAPKLKFAQEARLYVLTHTSKGVTVLLYTFVWRRDRVVAVVQTSGVRGVIGPGSVVTFVRKQDRRIRAALAQAGG